MSKEDKKHRILIIGDSPYVHTGYAYTCKELGKALHNAGFEVASVALWDKRKNDNVKTYNNITIPWPVYGCRTTQFDVFCSSTYLDIIRNFKPTLLIVNTDIWIAKYFLDINIQKVFFFHVEGEPIPINTAGIRGSINWPNTLLNCDYLVFAGPFGKRVTFDRLEEYAKKEKRDINIEEFKNKCSIIPDGVNTEVYKPLDNKGKLKKELWGLRETDFVIGYFGRQNPRKGIPYILEAFAKWLGRPSNAYFYCHCPLKDRYGWDLLQLIRDLKIENKVIVNLSLTVEKGVTEEKLNKFYNATDINCAISLGEGFGQTACVIPGAIVKTNKGHIPIEKVKPGYKVATHVGRWQKVKEVFKTWYKGSVCRFRTENSPPFSVTPTHKIAINKFLYAKDIKQGWYLRYPVIKEAKKIIDIVNKTFKLRGNKPKYRPFVASYNPATVFQYRDVLYSRNPATYNIIKKIEKNKVVTWYLSLFRKIIPQRKIYHYKYRKDGVMKFLSKITGIDMRHYEGYVYNMNVENDHSFLINGVAALHNCQSLSAGTPVLITDYSELSAFTEGTLKINPIAFYIEPRTNIRRAIPGIKDIYRCYKKVYKMFLNNKIEELETEARKDILARFDMKNMGQKWIDLINNIPIEYKEDKLPLHFVSDKLVSIILPVYNSNLVHLEKAIKSISDQNYKNIELVMVDDGSDEKTISEIYSLIGKYQKLSIRFISLGSNYGTAYATTEGIQNATGEYIGFIDHDDMLKYNCIEKTLEFMENNKEYGMVYTDEEIINEDDFQVRPVYKEDYNEDLLLAVMYINHFRLYKTNIVKEFIPLKHSGAQDLDLTLRVSEKYKIGHIREILYSWRQSKTSTLLTIYNRPEVITSNKAAVEDALKRRNIDAKVEIALMPTQWYINRKLKNHDPVSIIILNKDKWHLLEGCINSIEKYTKYPYEIIIVDTGSTDPNVLKYLKTTKHTVLHDTFNFSRSNNLAADVSQNPYLIFLNNDIIVSEGWITEMMKQLQRPDVAIVGPKMVFPNDRIQHAGLALGIQGLAHHMYIGQDKRIWLANLVREVSAVTGACLAIKKDIFEKAGKLDPEYMIEFQDVDLCLQVKKLGYKTIYTPAAELIHFTSQTRGNPTREQALNDRSRFAHRWQNELLGKIDPNLLQNQVDPNNDRNVKQWITIYKKLEKIRNKNNLNIQPVNNNPEIK